MRRVHFPHYPAAGLARTAWSINPWIGCWLPVQSVHWRIAALPEWEWPPAR